MSRITDNILPEELQAPPRLYHYTTQQGLLGILSSKTMWSTRIQYLNDSTEFSYTLELLKSEVQRRRERYEAGTQELDVPPNVSRAATNLFEGISKQFDRLSRIRIHVACFSEDGDMLSQWRGYCRSGSGFSVGFDSSQLVEAASRQSCFLAPCVYDLERQVLLVSQVIGDFLQLTKVKDDRKASEGFIHDCVFLACVLKHPTFREEREWRIVTRDVSDDHPQMGVRDGKVVPIPYFGFELVKPKEQLNVEVVVGPNPEMNLAMDSVATLMKVNKCLGSSRASVVPFREL